MKLTVYLKRNPTPIEIDVLDYEVVTFANGNIIRFHRTHVDGGTKLVAVQPDEIAAIVEKREEREDA